MIDVEALIEELETAVLSDHIVGIAETQRLLESAREDIRNAVIEVWDDGFDEASDDLGRAAMMADMGEDLNPYRKATGA